MSLQIMSMVMKHYPGAGGEYTLALCLADFANNSGDAIYPSIKTLAHNSRQSERTVQRQLRAMEECGWLEMSAPGGGAGRTARYRIAAAFVNAPETWQAKPRKTDGRRAAGAGHNPAFLGLPDHKKGDTGVTVTPPKRVTNSAKKGDTAMSPEQEQNLINTPLNPPKGSSDGCAVPSDIAEPAEAEIRKAGEWIFDRLLKLNPQHRMPNWRRWDREIRMLVTRDKRTLREICELFAWANADPFWSSNILSPGKLRKKWDQLVIKRKAERGNTMTASTPADYRCVNGDGRHGKRAIPGKGWLCAECLALHEEAMVHA